MRVLFYAPWLPAAGALALALPPVTGCRSSPAPNQSSGMPTIARPHVVVRLDGVDADYGEAFADILSEAREEYAVALGLELPQTLEMDVKLDPDGELRLRNDGASRIFLTVTSMEQLAPAPQSGVFHVYGLCHEVGHMAMYSRMENLSGLPDGVGEGWAHYSGSVVVDAVARRLGDKVWPEPYDVAGVEGTARLSRQVCAPGWAGLPPSRKAAKAFYNLGRQHGQQLVVRALDRALDTGPTGEELMPRFVEQVRKLSGDRKAGQWIPGELLVATLDSQPEGREIDEAFFADLKTQPDDTGVVLHYDDGTSDGERSIAGSGHAVLFQCPQGQWIVDRVSVFGCRYGTADPPDEDVQVYVCDEEFQPVAETSHPYELFDFAQRRWHDIRIDPVAAPERFYVCVAFDPTASKGVFVAYDNSVDRSHSRSALPLSHVSEVDGEYDWMIRVHLVPVGQ